MPRPPSVTHNSPRVSCSQTVPQTYSKINTGDEYESKSYLPPCTQTTRGNLQSRLTWGGFRRGENNAARAMSELWPSRQRSLSWLFNLNSLAPRNEKKASKDTQPVVSWEQVRVGRCVVSPHFSTCIFMNPPLPTHASDVQQKRLTVFFGAPCLRVCPCWSMFVYCERT